MVESGPLKRGEDTGRKPAQFGELGCTGMEPGRKAGHDGVKFLLDVPMARGCLFLFKMGDSPYVRVISLHTHPHTDTHTHTDGKKENLSFSFYKGQCVNEEIK